MRRASWIAFIAAAACGDPLVGPDFLGTPAFGLSGDVQRPEVGASPADENLRLSLFWIGFDSTSSRLPVIEQHTLLGAGLASFELTLFDAPPEEALRFGDLTGSADIDVGIALIVLYADRNANELLNAENSRLEESPDVVLGASMDHLVVYTTHAIEQGTAAWDLLGELEAGYHLYSNAGGRTCPFTQNQSCIGEGPLARVDPESETVVLTLWPTPEQVLVPNPAVPRGTSGTEPDNNLYGGR